MRIFLCLRNRFYAYYAIDEGLESSLIPQIMQDYAHIHMIRLLRTPPNAVKMLKNSMKLAENAVKMAQNVTVSDERVIFTVVQYQKLLQRVTTYPSGHFDRLS